MEASVRDLKAHLSEYLRRVADGEEIQVTLRGRVVARLSPPLAVAEDPQVYEVNALARLDALPWVRPGDGGKPRGSDRPIPWQPGQPTLSDLLLDDRE